MTRGPRVFVRECLACVKMVLDMVVNKQPHFLGEAIPVV
jgi:vancomycin permeability regulator SanA